MSEENTIGPIENPKGWTEKILKAVEPIIFVHRKKTHVVLWIITLAMLALSIYMFRLSAGFDKSIPMDHPYMQTRTKWVNDFGGGNTILIALMTKDGSEIYKPEFIKKMKGVEVEMQQISGIDPVRLRSFATSNSTFIEVVEGGLGGETVLAGDYPFQLKKFQDAGNQAGIDQLHETVKANVVKSGLLGLLVTQKHDGAILKAEVLSVNPQTGKEFDYQLIAKDLETRIREKYSDDNISIHIIGFAKAVGDVADGAKDVAMFFAIALFMTTALLWWYVGSFRLAMLPLFASIVAVIWEFGLLFMFGFGIDPFAVLVPFLILAVSVSHGVQYANCWVSEIEQGYSSFDASVLTFRRLAIPGTVALFTDIAGFLTILLINIDVMQEMAINATFGVAAIIITNKILMPIWLTYVRIPDVAGFQEKQRAKERKQDPIWHWMSNIVNPVPSAIVLFLSGIALAWAIYMYPKLQVGDAQPGVPELWEDSRYNQDTYKIVGNFDLGTDILAIIAETHDDACIDSAVMQNIDRFVWQMSAVEGVQQVSAITNLAKRINSGFSEGRLNATSLPRNRFTLSQATGMIPTDSGMLNRDCNGLSLDMFLEDHKADTIIRAVDAVKRYNAINRIQDPIAETLLDVRADRVRFRVFNNNAGTVVATMEAGERSAEGKSLEDMADESNITVKELKKLRKETAKAQKRELQKLRDGEAGRVMNAQSVMAGMVERLNIAGEGNSALKAAIKESKKGDSADVAKIAAKLEQAIQKVRSDWPALELDADLSTDDKLEAFTERMDEARVGWPLTDPRQFVALEDANKLVVFWQVNETVSAFDASTDDSELRAEFFQEVEDKIKAFDQQTAHNINFGLATATVGVMAATNEVIHANEVLVVGLVYIVIVVFLTLSFGSILGMLCVVLPLLLVSTVAYGVMVVLGIGMKVATLPVMALAVGIGVDYGIYIFSTIAEGFGKGQDLKEAYFNTLRTTGKAVMFIGISLGLSVCTWLFSELKFQADMGKLLLFIFTANMFGALLILPVLTGILVNPKKISAGIASH